GARSSKLETRKGLGGRDVRGLGTLWALDDLELHALTLRQRLVAVHRDRGEVDEDVVATLPLDEPITLLVREPLDGALLQPFPPTRAPARGHGATDTAAERYPSTAPKCKQTAPEASGFEGRAEQKRDRHRTDAARYGRDETGHVGHRGIDVPAQALVGAVDADVDHGGARLDHVRCDEPRPSDR